MTTLVCVRKPTVKERKERHAEVVFVREDRAGREHLVYGAKCHESWEQWGAGEDVLWDNMDAIEQWRNSL